MKTKLFPLVAAVALACLAFGLAQAATPKARAIPHVSSETFESTSTVTFQGPVAIQNSGNVGSVTLGALDAGLAFGGAAGVTGSRCFCSNRTGERALRCNVDAGQVTAIGTSASDVVGFVCF